ncbi:hypothetical protein DFH06DRAFT_686379 [Mycena polygramma]|nr:hypothetical protein DFH06DRAFT_686379 [Mycena polygramma]
MGCPQTGLVCSRFSHCNLIPSNNQKTLIDTRSAPAWMSCLTIFLNPGDSFITDVPLTQARAMDTIPVAIATDLDGILAVELERVLTTWDERLQAAASYLLPRRSYQPNGPAHDRSTEERVRHDLIINIEDDPYYFQQASAAYAAR